MFNNLVKNLRGSESLLRSERLVAGVVFAFLIIASIAPTGVLKEGSSDVFGYSVPRRSGGIIIHTPTTRQEKVEAEERDNTRTSHINSLRSAILDYRAKHGKYPSSITSELTEICNTNLSSVDCTGLVDLSVLGMRRVPVDPNGYYGNRNGTGYLIAKGSIRIVAPHAETGSISLRITDEEVEARERIAVLQEKAEELYVLVEEKFRRGELPATARVPVGKPYIENYIIPGGSNVMSDVQKLQTFLNKHMGESLAVNGVYDSATIEAVKRFQLKYASEILHPWGINEPTGFVYLTTLRKINALEHPDRYFPMPSSLRPYSVSATTHRTQAVRTTTTGDTYHRDVEIVDDQEEDVEDMEGIEDVEDYQEEDEITWGEELEEVEEDERNNTLIWTIIILSSIMFMVIVYYMRNLGNADSGKNNKF